MCNPHFSEYHAYLTSVNCNLDIPILCHYACMYNVQCRFYAKYTSI